MAYAASPRHSTASTMQHLLRPSAPRPPRIVTLALARPHTATHASPVSVAAVEPAECATAAERYQWDRSMQPAPHVTKPYPRSVFRSACVTALCCWRDAFAHSISCCQKSAPNLTSLIRVARTLKNSGHHHVFGPPSLLFMSPGSVVHAARPSTQCPNTASTTCSGRSNGAPWSSVSRTIPTHAYVFRDSVWAV